MLSINKGGDKESVFKNPELSARGQHRAGLGTGDFGRHMQGQSQIGRAHV